MFTSTLGFVLSVGQHSIGLRKSSCSSENEVHVHGATVNF